MKESVLACKKCEAACREMAKAAGDPEAESSKAK